LVAATETVTPTDMDQLVGALEEAL